MTQLQQPYTDGTATVAAGGTIITVTGLLDDNVAREGDHFRDPATGYETRILARIDGTHIQVPPYRSAALSSADYEIYPDSTLRLTNGNIAATTQTLVNRVGSKGIIWILPPGFADPTSAKIGAPEGQWEFDPVTGTFWHMESGSWVVRNYPGYMSTSITDSTAIGRALLTSANASTALTLLGGVGVARVTVSTSSGMYTPHANLMFALAQLVGGGGAGGGANGNPATGNFGSGAGGGGEYAFQILFPATIGASRAITIGAGGVGGGGGSVQAGTDGGDSSIAGLLSAGGGKGGGPCNGATVPYGGAGGSGSSGALFSIPGGRGGSGEYINTGSNPVAGVCGGEGGSSHLGIGGVCPMATGSFVNGRSGSGFGAGGSGSAVQASATNGYGGNGTGGVCIITEFCSQ